MRRLFLLCLLLSLIIAGGCFAQWTKPAKGAGYLCRPPIYMSNEQDFPLTPLGAMMPGPGELQPDVDLSGLSADHFNRDGVNVQPGLDVELNWIRVSVMRGFLGGWDAGISVPWYRNKVKGSIGGFPAGGVAEGFGNISLLGRKIVWDDCKSGSQFIAGFGVELPTGASEVRFGQNNIVTNGYFRDERKRIPLEWQPSTGTFNGLLTLAFVRSWNRFTWEALVGGKINGTDDEDVKVGNLFIGSLQSTYGISRRIAASLGFTYRAQASDDYPNSPLPVNGPLLDGTTCHSPLLYVDVGLRYSIKNMVTVGFSVRTPIVDPQAGMDPTGTLSVIFYPNVD